MTLCTWTEQHLSDSDLSINFMSKETNTSEVREIHHNGSVRLQIATQAMGGLLASQNPEKGWNLDTLAILSLKIADNLIHFSKEEKLPELISASPKKV